MFIRRDVKNNTVYKFVLREYLGYLVEKRFSLEWYIEGGRSRTGKQLPPKLGLLTYLVSAYREGRVDDLMLMPISIAYDQLHEVSEYAAEAHGGKKRPENLVWFVRFFRAQKKPRSGGSISVSPSPCRCARCWGRRTVARPRATRRRWPRRRSRSRCRGGSTTSRRLRGRRLFRPILLAHRGRALTLDQVRAEIDDYLISATRRRLPLAPTARINDVDATRRTLDSLAQHNVVHEHKGGLETVYSIGGNQHLAAAFYRNTIIHFFVNAAIGGAGAAGEGRRGDVRRARAGFWMPRRFICAIC